MENRSFILLVLALAVLIAVAIWQFYSLAWGESASSLRQLNNGAPAAATLPKQ